MKHSINLHIVLNNMTFVNNDSLPLRLEQPVFLIPFKPLKSRVASIIGSNDHIIVEGSGNGLGSSSRAHLIKRIVIVHAALQGLFFQMASDLGLPLNIRKITKKYHV